jgi:hypothetical protein
MKRKYRLVVSTAHTAIRNLIAFAMKSEDEVYLSWNHSIGSHTIYFVSSKQIVVRLLLQAALERTTGHLQLDLVEEGEYSRIQHAREVSSTGGWLNAGHITTIPLPNVHNI